MRIEPDFPDALNNLGIVLAQTGRAEEAAERFAKALELKPDYAEAANNRGIALAQLRRYDQAESVPITTDSRDQPRQHSSL